MVLVFLSPPHVTGQGSSVISQPPSTKEIRRLHLSIIYFYFPIRTWTRVLPTLLRDVVLALAVLSTVGWRRVGAAPVPVGGKTNLTEVTKTFKQFNKPIGLCLLVTSAGNRTGIHFTSPPPSAVHFLCKDCFLASLLHIFSLNLTSIFFWFLLRARILSAVFHDKVGTITFVSSSGGGRVGATPEPVLNKIPICVFYVVPQKNLPLCLSLLAPSARHRAGAPAWRGCRRGAEHGAGV